jgi:hypothetical protein
MRSTSPVPTTCLQAQPLSPPASPPPRPMPRQVQALGASQTVQRVSPDESHVFNGAGQDILLEDLLLVCCRQDDHWVPCGNPVKDSMATKVHEATSSAVGIIYAPCGTPHAELSSWANQYAALLRSAAGAANTQVTLF